MWFICAFHSKFIFHAIVYITLINIIFLIWLYKRNSTILSRTLGHKRSVCWHISGAVKHKQSDPPPNLLSDKGIYPSREDLDKFRVMEHKITLGFDFCSHFQVNKKGQQLVSGSIPTQNIIPCINMYFLSGTWRSFTSLCTTALKMPFLH